MLKLQSQRTSTPAHAARRRTQATLSAATRDLVPEITSNLGLHPLQNIREALSEL
jgi:hypothetical protein